MAIRRDKSSVLSPKRRQQLRRATRRRGLLIEQLEDRRVFASPELVSINPNQGDIFNLTGGANVRNIAPRELTLRFQDGQIIDPASINGNVVITRAGGDDVFGGTNDVVVQPGFIGIGESPNEIIVRFSENLPDDLYRITLVGAGATPLRNAGGEAFHLGQNQLINFELDLGAQVVAVVPQPVDIVNGVRTQRANQIDVFFNNDDLNVTLAQNVNFYKLIATNGTVENGDDFSHTPISAVYSAAQDKVTLTFASNLDQLLTGAGTYRLRIGTNESIPGAPTAINQSVDPSSTFAGATVVGGVNEAGVIISSQITPDSWAYPLTFPGDNSEPGHRDVPVVADHLGGGADNDSNIPRFGYNFQPFVNGFTNHITEAQKQRAREIFEIYSYYLGIDFVETASTGISVVTGDLAILNGDSGPGAVAGLGGGGIAVMDIAESWGDDYGGSWFQVAMHEIGHVLGLGHTYDLPPGTIMGDDGTLSFNNGSEPVFPGLQDIVHGQYLYRPDSIDIDMYRFDVTTTGTLTAETFAERKVQSSSLNTVLRLYRDVNGVRTLLAQNDDYFSDDSFLKLKLEPGTYYIGVSSTGNDDYDPTIPDTGLGGTSQGTYDLRLNFRADVINTLADAQRGVAFDGDLDGAPGGVYNFWFNVASQSNTLFVDKSAVGLGNGSLASPFNNIQSALNAATPGQIVRILGNGGTDNSILTTADALPYLIGSDANGNALADGRNLDVPRGVTVMIDAGAVFKSRRGSISVGSNSATIDRSGGALQVLGTPLSSVIFTSFNDDSYSGDTNGATTPAAPGNWGGIIFQNEIDRDNQRFEYEQEGIFINYVNHADIRYGGGSVSINGIEQVVAPIYLTEARPTVTFNLITSSADAAISADPNSFEETNFHDPTYQATGAFTSDYDRVGPDIYGNRLIRTQTTTVGTVTTTTTHANSINGLFVRIATPGGSTPKKLTTQARFDDLDIVHVIAENLVIDGTPGGGFQDLVRPAVELVTTTPVAGGTLAAGAYTYVITYVDAAGNESPPSFSTPARSISGANRSIRLDNLPATTAGYTARRIYRSFNGGAYDLVAQIVSNTQSYLDNGATAGGALVPNLGGVQARLDARLAIDPGVILKMSAARIEAAIGTTFIAEGTAALPIIITSLNDDRYGAGGTFDQTGSNSPNTPARGDWGGIFLGPVSSGSIDHAVLAYGGGTVRVAGTSTGYNVLEIHQADARVTNSVFEQNGNGLDPTGQAPSSRFGAGWNTASTIFVRGAEPIIVSNIIRNNTATAISINANSLNSKLVVDHGRSTGAIDRIENFKDNQGAMIRLNRLLNNGVNGMVIRGETLHTEGVWDDTDITHVLFSTIYIVNFHTYGGLRLESSQSESLVVKFFGPNAGITATGKPIDIDDRIGGILNIVGQPGRPVILTSLRDDKVGAGKRPDGSPQLDTNNDGAASVPAAGDWRSVLIDQYAHDRNVDIVVEGESPNSVSPGSNSTPATAQSLGGLAASEANSDENLRLGYVIHGYLNAPNDVDVYSFSGKAGTEIWLDIDSSTIALDSVIELVDADGVTLARSNNSYFENFTADNPDEYLYPASPNLIGKSMRKSAQSNGVDYWATNTRDAGMRLVLPGATGATNTYYVRVRSAGADPADPTMAGLTSGMYELQVRIRELDEKPGTTVRFTNISYATNGIEVYGQPTHSQLAGEAGEEGSSNDTMGNATDLGNILSTDRMAMSIAGSLGKEYNGRTNTQLADVDFYRFQVGYDGVQQIAGVTAGSIFSTIFDIDYADRTTLGNMSLWLFDSQGRLIVSNRDSNLNDDHGRANHPDDVADLTRGTTNTYDPFIGAQILPEGEYYIAVTANGVLPTTLTSQALVRLEPVNSLNRIAEDHISTTGGSTPAPTQIGRLIDGTSAVPYHLGDLALYLMQERPDRGALSTRVLTVNPFTGAVQTVVNANMGDSRTSFGRDIGDFAFRSDGNLYSFSIGNDVGGDGRSDGNSGNYLLIDSGNGTITQIGDDNIVTLESNGATPTPGSQVSHLTGSGARIGWGVQFHAMTFYMDANGNEHLYAIGNRGDSDFEGIPLNNGPTRKHNLMYEFDVNTGAFRHAFQTPTFGGSGTNAIPFGNFDYNPAAPTLNMLQSATEMITGMTQVPNNAQGQGGLIYAVTNEGRLYSISQNLNSAGATITYIGTSATDLLDIEFTGVTVGPWNTEGGRYRNTLFATAEDGRIYAFNLAGELQPIFVNGATSIYTGETDLVGIGFGEVESNLWGQTNNRGGDAGHGINLSFDGSREAVAGGASYYFGDQNGGFNFGLAGGAHGTLVTNEFSLKGYSAADQPMTYFTYYMEGDGSTDAFKVFVGGDDGEWLLLNAPSNVAPASSSTGSGGVWRQMRIPLAAVAGQEHLRLRFDFSTSGDMNVGDKLTTGSELRAKRGDQILDGQVFTLGDVNDPFGASRVTFEFERGPTLFANSGAGMRDGDSFILTATGGAPVRFEMNSTGGVTAGSVAIPFTTVMTPSQVATAISNAILGAGFLPANVQLLDEKVNILGLEAFVAPNFMRSQGNVGVTPGNVPVSIHMNMTREQVAAQMDAVLEATLAEQRLVLLAANQYVDGDWFRLSDGTTDVDFEFDTDGVVTAGRVGINISTAVTARDVATAVDLAIDNSPLTALGYTARIDTFDLRRVAIVKAQDDLLPLTLTPNTTTAGAVTFQAIDLANGGISKSYKDLVRVIGYDVLNAGPLGNDAIDYDPYPGAPINDANETFYQDLGVGVALQGDVLSYPFFDPTMAGLRNRRVGFNSPTTGQNNNFEGFYLDDIIIGFAERGEIATGATPDATFNLNVSGLFAPPLSAAEIAAIQAANERVSFAYQLEIRSGEDYATGGREFTEGPAAGVFTDLTNSWDTNQRMSSGYILFAQAGNQIVDGQTFEITDGIKTVRFEFNDTATGLNNYTPGNLPIQFNSSSTNFEVARAIRNAINSPASQSLLPNITASTSDGELVGTVSTDWWVTISGEATIQLTGSVATPANVPPIGVPGNNYGLKGDTNRVRDQGQIILSSNIISNVAQYGMVLDAGRRVPDPTAPNAGDLPHQGVVRNLRTVNTDRLVPGVVVMNNIVANGGTGGIHISGDPNTGGQTMTAPVPFARVVNNTIYGGGVGTGIVVDQNASPTLMNNIVANLATGVSVDASSSTTVLTGMLYQGNATDVVGTSKGSFELTLLPTDPLFVNAAAGNFYLAALSKAIDSSVDSLSDRNNYLNYKSQVGLGASPILSPTRDVTGQLRQDDPLVEPQGGVGQNVFKDRGAVDRVDVEGPTAVVTTPPDNDANGLDQNPGVGDVEVNGIQYSAFTIQLLDGVDPFQAQNGTGIDDTTIAPVTLPDGTVLEKITVTRDGVALVRGVHFTIQYDAVNDVISIVPLTGVWELGRTYVITLDNSALNGIKDLAGNPIKSNRADGSTRFSIRLGIDPTPPAPNGIDYGDAPDPIYPSLASSNGARHIIQTGFFLGSGVSAETNARPNDTDTSDDGVVFASGSQLVIGRSSMLTVTASQAGVLDAWVDFNRNGTWEANEKVFSQSLTAGANNLSLAVPAASAAGVTYARFRFSTAGNLAPTGTALDGEVEDYAIGLIKNPWTNPGTGSNAQYDVNGDGKVTPTDALLVINYMNANGNGAVLPIPPLAGNSPPPYVDVINDGLVTPQDVNAVINYLNANGSGEAVEDSGQSLAVESLSAPAESSTADNVGSASSSVESNSPQFLLDTQAGVSTPLSTASAAASGFVVSTTEFQGYTPLATTDVWADYLADIDGNDSDDEDLDALLEEVAYGDSADDYFTSLGA